MSRERRDYIVGLGLSITSMVLAVVAFILACVP